MAVSSKRNATLRQFFKNMKAHTLSISFRSQHRPQHSAHTPSCNLEDREPTCFLKQSGGTAERLSPFVVPVHQVFLIVIGRFPLWPRPT